MKKWLLWILLIVGIVIVILAIPEISYKNTGKSRSIGSVGKGGIENPYLMPYSGNNFRYFSQISYYLLDNGYVNSKVHATTLDAYTLCESTCKGVEFRIMECSNRTGGKMLIHRTHQNGLSIDFMVPKKKGDSQSKLFDRLGIFHYLLEFTNSGQLKLDKKVEIDFEAMGRHLLALDDASRKNELRIKKVILKIELKDDFYKTKSGRKVKQRGIYFAKALSNIVNDVHDDHYHVDFEIRK